MNATKTKHVPAVKTLYRLRRTGQTRVLYPEFGEPIELPEVELVSVDLDIPSPQYYDSIAAVEGEKGRYYLENDQWLSDRDGYGGQATVLVRELHASDAGGNQVRRRVAPQTRQGIAARTLSGATYVHGSEPVYAVRPEPRNTSRAESGEQACVLRVASAKRGIAARGRDVTNDRGGVETISMTGGSGRLDHAVVIEGSADQCGPGDLWWRRGDREGIAPEGYWRHLDERPTVAE